MIGTLLWKIRELGFTTYPVPIRDRLINRFKNELYSILKEELAGVYLIGSLALGDHNKKYSDIDFVVLCRSLDYQKVVKKIAAVHKKLIQLKLNGIYVTYEQLGKTAKEIKSLLYHHEGRLYFCESRDQLYEINPITWFELKHNAITLQGIKAKELPLHIQCEDLINYICTNANTYWKQWLQKSSNPFHPYYYYTLLSMSGVAWCATGLTRQLYTLKEGKISSKQNACYYGIKEYPRYSRLFKSIIDYRSGSASKKAFSLKGEMLHFMEFAIEHLDKTLSDRSLAEKPTLSDE